MEPHFAEDPGGRNLSPVSTPASASQSVADQFHEAGVKAILNFSPAQIHLPDSCLVEHIDFTVKLDILTYKLKHEIGAAFNN